MPHTITIILITCVVTYSLMAIIQLAYNKYKVQKQEKTKQLSEILDLSALKNSDISDDTLPHQELSGRKYLEEINAKLITSDIPQSDLRQEKWQEERDIYGFDETEIWNLDNTMIELLYERVKMYVDRTPIDLDNQHIKINGQSKTQGQWIDILLKLCEKLIQNTDRVDIESAKYKKEIWTIWRELSRFMLW